MAPPPLGSEIWGGETANCSLGGVFAPALAVSAFRAMGMTLGQVSCGGYARPASADRFRLRCESQNVH